MKNYIPLTEQEELTLRQLATQSGYEVIFKLLQMISLDAQDEAMSCRDGDKEKRLLLLMDAQAMESAVSKIIRRLASYRNALVAEKPEVIDEAAELIENLWNQRSN